MAKPIMKCHLPGTKNYRISAYKEGMTFKRHSLPKDPAGLATAARTAWNEIVMIVIPSAMPAAPTR